MTMITSNLTPALKATCRLSSIRRQGPVHRRRSAALLCSLRQRAAVQLQPLLFLPSVLDPQVRHDARTNNTHNTNNQYYYCSYNIVFVFSLKNSIATLTVLNFSPQIRPPTGAGAAASPRRCLNTRMGIYSIIHPCLTQGTTVSKYILQNSHITLEKSPISFQRHVRCTHLFNS